MKLFDHGPALRPLSLASAVVLILASCAGCDATQGADARVHIDGVVWQPDNATVTPRGKWDQLGAHELLVQWTAVDAKLPDWQRIAAEPWAREVIVGLAGSFDEKAVRADIEKLVADSAALAKWQTPLHVSGWYFPVEIDSTWQEAPRLAALMAQLPRPCGSPCMDSANVGPEALAAGLLKWLPADVGVFFQDGVSVYAREPRVARHYADLLVQRLGRERVRIIAEMFRPLPGRGFRSATAEEIKPQLNTYSGYRISAFDGPHYLPDQLVEQLQR